MGAQADELYGMLCGLRKRAEAARAAEGASHTQAELQKRVRAISGGEGFYGRRVSEWAPYRREAFVAPRESSYGQVLALVAVWSRWAGDRQPDARLWRDRLRRADAEREDERRAAARARRAGRSAAGGGSAHPGPRPGSAPPDDAPPAHPDAPPAEGAARPGQDAVALAAARSTAPRAPADTTSFMLPESRIAGFVERPAVGQRLLEALLSPAAAGGPPVALVGPGGYGKTYLAVWAARQVRDRFPDGVLWIQPPRGEAALTRLVCELIGLLTGTGIPRYRILPVAAAAFTRALGQRRILVVLDNVWDTAALEAFRAGPRCVTLVTGRRRFGDRGHAEVEVGGMTGSEAAAVLLRRAGNVPEGAAAQVAPLALRCGHWPLPLSLLGGVLPGLLRRKPLAEAVRELLSGLERHGVGSVDGFAAEAGPGIANALLLSLDHLAATSPHGEASRERFRQLAAFPADQPVDVSLLERLWGLGAAAAQSECDRFFDHCLIEENGSRGVRLHDPVREHLRALEPGLPRETSRTLLRRSRPAAGWHALAASPRDPLAAGLAGHLVQAGHVAELLTLTRDLRYLAARVHHDGPAAAEADVRTALEAAGAEPDGTAEDGPLAGTRRLLARLRADAHLLTGPGATATDAALRLYGRLAGQVDLTHLGEALPEVGLYPDPSTPEDDAPRPVRSLAGHTGQVSSVFWLSDGRLATVGGDDGSLRRWDAATGAQTSHVPLDAGFVLRAWPSPDERHLAVLCQPTDGRALPAVAVVDAVSGKHVGHHPAAADGAMRQFLHGGLPTAAWSPDSRSLAQAHGDVIDIWSPFEERVLRTLPVPSAGMALDWHRDGGLACVTATGRLLRWPDPMAGETVLKGQVCSDEDIPRALAWSPDGRVITVATDACIIVTGMPTGDPTHLQYPMWGVHPCGLSWRPDGRAFAMAANGGFHVGSSVTTWDVTSHSGGAADLLDVRQAGTLGLAWNPRGDLLAVAGTDSTVRLWHPATAVQPPPAEGRRSPWSEEPWHTAEAASLFGDGLRYGNVLSSNIGLTVYSGLDCGQPAAPRSGGADVVTGLPGGRALTAAWAGGGPMRWVMSSTQACQDFRIAMSVAQQTLGFPDIELTLRTTAGDALARTVWHRPRYLAVDPTGRRLALTGENGDVRLLDTASLSGVATFTCDEAITCAAFTPDGQRLVVATRTGLQAFRLTRPAVGGGDGEV